MARTYSSLQHLAIAILLLWSNLVSSFDAPTPVNQVDRRLVDLLHARNIADSQHAPPGVEVVAVGKAEARPASPQDLRRRDTTTTTTSSAAASQTSDSGGGGLDSIITGFVDAFSCVGNASALFAGLESLLAGLGADTTFIRAAEDVLFSENFTLFETPTFFLGIGVGEATIVGLNASTEEESRAYVANSIAASGENDTGMNALFRKFGQGVVNITLPAVLNSNADDFLAGLNLSELVAGAGIGVSDGIGIVLKPLFGSSVFDVSVNGTGNFSDPKGAGAVAYSFTRGLSSQLSSLALGFLGIGNDTTSAATTSTASTLRSRGSAAQRDSSAPRVSARDDPTMGSALGQARGLILPEHESKFESPDSLLINSSKTDQITSSLAQEAVSRLSCQGIGGAVSLFSNLLPGSSHAPVPSLPDLGGLQLPDIQLVVRNDGNLFEIGLQDLSAAVNGVPLNRLVALIAAHVVIALAAFLALFPTILIIGAIERLAIAIRRPINPWKLQRWLMVLQVGVLPLLAIVGLVLGVLSGGNSAHFRTPHGILGLVLVALSLIYSILACIGRRRTSNGSRKSPEKRSRVGVVESLVIVLMMGLIFATWITGLEDARSLSLCLVDQVSMTIVAVVSTAINGVWGWAVTIILVEWWLSRRLSKAGRLANGSSTNGI